MVICGRSEPLKRRLDELAAGRPPHLSPRVARGRLHDGERRDFYLYIDEFHTFATLSLAGILQEARKYRLNLIIAHQYLGQLGDEVRAAMSSVGSFSPDSPRDT